MPEIIPGGVYTSPLRLEGPRWNGARFGGKATFRNIRGAPAIWIGGCSGATLEGFDIEACDEGVHLSNRQSAPDCRLADFSIRDIRGDGIQAGEGGLGWHAGLVIEDGTIERTGTAYSNGSKHAVYSQVTGVYRRLVIIDTTGNGLSLRRGGQALDNWISGAAKACIRYFPDHKADPGTILDIARNFVAGWGEAGIDLLLTGTATMANAIDAFRLADNVAAPGRNAFRFSTALAARVTVNAENLQLGPDDEWPARPGVPVVPPVNPEPPPHVCPTLPVAGLFAALDEAATGLTDARLAVERANAAVAKAMALLPVA